MYIPVWMLRLMDDCVLIEGQELMNHYVQPLRPLILVLLYRYSTDLILRLTEQNLLELVLQPLVLLVSSQMLDLLHRLLGRVLYFGVHRLHFVCFLFDLFVELVVILAVLVVVVVLQGFVLSLLLPQQLPQSNL
jgi:hypothetical protein